MILDRYSARLLVLAAAILFSTGGTAIKACDFTGWQIASFRSGIAAVLLLVLIPATRRGWSLRSAAAGAALGATLVLFATSNKLTTAANTIFLQSSAPLYILLLSPILLKEAARLRDGVIMILVAAGLVLFFMSSEAPQTKATDPLLGNMLAGASGVTWALTLIGLRSLGREGGTGNGVEAAVVIGNLIAFAVCLPMAVPVVESSAVDWLLVALLGVFQIGVAYWALAKGIAGVAALEASILLLVEPTLNPVWAYAFHREMPGHWAVAGGILILGATVLKSVWDSRSPVKVRHLPDS